MNANDIKSYYLEFVRDQTNEFDDGIKNFIYEISDKFLSYIINYSIEYSITLDEIEYRKVFEITDTTESESKDVDFMLYVLSLKPYDAIKWVHYFESNAFFEPNREYLTGEELLEIKESGCYYNPLTGNDISKNVFYDELCTVFGTTDDFKKQIIKLKMRGV
ncbi:hypothetical protein [Psychrobacter sp. UBA3962]|uniref:hypothetical protein n=1 Tax=Psychrobacter sp. UBA3962 TaxID=1947352 RepID=UPI0025EBEF43|nr:hypothetical protein [Psychrobacter sp. UBA3962]